MILASRSIAGPVLLELRTREIPHLVIQMTDKDAIALCDSLRRVIEDPTLRDPSGENLTVMRPK
jgi:hypothetical protein